MGKFPPDWFDLKNYDVCRYVHNVYERFGRSEWALVINTRRKLYYDFINYYKDTEIDTGELLANLREASLSNHLALEWKQPDFVSIGGGHSFTEFGWSWGFDGGLNKLGNLMRSEWVFPRDEDEFEIEREFGANAKYQLDSYEVGINEEAEDYFLESCYLANFDFSDEQIIADFKTWLFSKREKQFNQFRDGGDMGREMTKTMRARLHEQRILPYMDLYLYLLFSGIVKPTYAEIAEVLFPPDFVEWTKDYAEVLRETIHPRAIKILESPVLLI